MRTWKAVPASEKCLRNESFITELGQFRASSNMCGKGSLGKGSLGKGSLGKGSLVLKLGYSFRTCSNILKAEAIKNNDAELRDRCDRYEALYTGDWFDSVCQCLPVSTASYDE